MGCGDFKSGDVVAHVFVDGDAKTAYEGGEGTEAGIGEEGRVTPSDNNQNPKI